MINSFCIIKNMPLSTLHEFNFWTLCPPAPTITITHTTTQENFSSNRRNTPGYSVFLYLVCLAGRHKTLQQDLLTNLSGRLTTASRTPA